MESSGTKSSSILVTKNPFVVLKANLFTLFLVAEEVQPVGGPAVHRIRLYDELEQV